MVDLLQEMKSIAFSDLRQLFDEHGRLLDPSMWSEEAANDKGKLLIIWDGLPAHRSRLVRDYVESFNGQIALERLPGYAPEPNPVEYLFGYAKQRELGNLCVETIAEVRRYATRRLKSMQRRPTLIRAFWKQAELPI